MLINTFQENVVPNYYKILIMLENWWYGYTINFYDHLFPKNSLDSDFKAGTWIQMNFLNSVKCVVNTYKKNMVHRRGAVLLWHLVVVWVCNIEVQRGEIIDAIYRHLHLI